jgi:hypothetical protein
MSEETNSSGSPPQHPAEPEQQPVPLEEAERLLLDRLGWAAHEYRQKGGRRRGAKIAVSAAVLFLKERGNPPWIAAALMDIAGSLDSVDRGATPPLFSYGAIKATERSRSPERKHIQTLAAMALEVLTIYGSDPESQSFAAKRIARAVKGWPHMGSQRVTATTVINWRKHLKRSKNQKLEKLVSVTLATPHPLATIADLLRDPNMLPPE